MTSWKGIGLALNCQFTVEDGYFKVLPVLLELLPQMFFWKDITHVGAGEPGKLTAAALKKAATAKLRSWKLGSSADEFPDVSFICHRVGDGLTLHLLVHDEAWRRAGRGLGPAIEGAAWQLIRALRGAATFLTSSGVYPSFLPSLSYDHLDPEPDHPDFRFDLVLDLFDYRMVQRWKDSGAPDTAAVLERVFATPVPRGVHRVEDDQQIVQLWTQNLHEEEALKQAAASHERWLNKAIAGKS